MTGIAKEIASVLKPTSCISWDPYKMTTQLDIAVGSNNNITGNVKRDGKRAHVSPSTNVSRSMRACTEAMITCTIANPNIKTKFITAAPTCMATPSFPMLNCVGLCEKSSWSNDGVQSIMSSTIDVRDACEATAGETAMPPTAALLAPAVRVAESNVAESSKRSFVVGGTTVTLMETGLLYPRQQPCTVTPMLSVLTTSNSDCSRSIICAAVLFKITSETFPGTYSTVLAPNPRNSTHVLQRT